jgi:type VI secretion system protein ImpJ
MSEHRRVVWSEGMLLSPQHLQQWDRYAHHLVRERFRATQAFEWGLTQLEVDREALRNGRMALASARGVLPDGTPFAAPDEDPLPPAHAFEGHFGTKQESLAVYLGLPAARMGRPQLGERGAEGHTPRYASESIELADDNTGSNERGIMVAQRNLVLLFPDDPLGDHDVLPIAEVVRTADAGYALRESYIPPCLSVGASEALLRLLRTELEMLITKSSEIGDQRRQRGGVADFSSTDTGNFLLLHTVNAYIPVLSHFVGQRRAHPEQVYLTLATLAGMLCTFAADLHAKDLPPYEHRGLAATFAGLHTTLSRLLEVGFRAKAVRIDLEKKDGSIYVGRVQDPRLLEPGASLFLGVRAEAEEQQLVRELPYKFKIASLDRIDFLIANALRGVPMNFTRVPPASLPVKSNFLYFQLDPNCEVWEGVKGAKNLAIYAPPDYPGMTLELLGLRE